MLRICREHPCRIRRGGEEEPLTELVRARTAPANVSKEDMLDPAEMFGGTPWIATVLNATCAEEADRKAPKRDSSWLSNCRRASEDY